MPGFGQVVVGPPGSGKTTYCRGMLQFFAAIGRAACVFNMDPSNENVPYEAAADISEVVCASTVAAEYGLGPNGSQLYCMEYLEKHPEWLDARLQENRGKYILFDLPGQVELYTHNNCVRNIVLKQLQKKHQLRITAVNLVDAHYVSDPAKFISALLMSVTQMLQLELPAINVLSKVDLITEYGDLPQDLELEFFTESGGGDLTRLLDSIGRDRVMARYAKLNHALIQVIEDFSFVAFHTLDINNKESVIRVSKAIDKSNGYMYTGLDASKVTYEGLVGKEDRDPRWTDQVQERYVKR